MDPASDRSSPRRYGYLIRGACACAAAIAAMDLVGWWSGVNALTHLLPGYPGMNPLTAICLLLTAASLWILGVERSQSAARTLARAMAALVLTLASLRALELGFGIDLPLDDVLFGSRVLAVTFPARMSAHTAFTLACIGSALFVHDLPGRAGRRLDEILLVVATAVVLTVLTGYLFGASPLHGLMPIPSAAATLLLSTAGLLAEPDRGLCGLLLRDSPGGLMMRRVLAVAVPLPIVLGWLRLAGQRMGLYDLEMGTALLVLGIIAMLVTLVTLTGVRLDASDADRRRAEQALRQSVERQSRILAANLVGTVIGDGTGMILDANPAFFAMTGYTREDLPLHTDTLTPPEWHERSHQAIREYQETGVATPYEKEYVRKDGTRLPVLIGAATLPDSGGQALAFVVDLSARRSAERELERTRLFLDSIIENLPIMVFVKDAEHLRFVRFNRAGEELIGFSRQDLIGKSDHDFFPAEEAEFFTSKDRAVLASGTLLDIPEEPIQTRHQGERILHTKKVPILDHDGSPRYLLGISEDITERKRAERELVALNADLARHAAEIERANRELESFSYSVSHDLRAPLRHIDGFADMLLQQSASALDEKGRRYLENIAGSAKSMGRLIDDLLAFSRMSRTSLRSADVDLDAMVAEIRDQLARDTADRRIEWRIAPLGHVAGDPAMLRVVFTNLLSNAVKYTGGRAEAVIEVDAIPTDADDVIRVRDNGVGFDMNYAHKLFGVFQRLHRDDEFEGTGIGLATVRRIVDRHGGRTWAEAEPDRGAAFHVALPRAGERTNFKEAA